MEEGNRRGNQNVTAEAQRKTHRNPATNWHVLSLLQGWFHQFFT
jgi:hypothetical protein